MVHFCNEQVNFRILLLTVMRRVLIYILIFIIGETIYSQNIPDDGLAIEGARPPELKIIEGTPLEHRVPSSLDQMPAFPSQTRANAVITETPFKEEVITSDLNHPWGMAFMPDGRIMISEKPGNLRIVTLTGNIRDKIKGLPDDIYYSGDGGLLDIVLDPDFLKNRKFYFTYVQKREGGSGLVVASAVLSKDDFSLEDLKIIYRIDNTSQSVALYGSRLLFDKERKLLITTGERISNETRLQAQWLSSPLGKILRINTDGTPAQGNPVFPDSVKALPEIWAYGVKNPEGITFNHQTGDLWEDEIGTFGGDEVNIIMPGKNYGWPVIAYGSEYDFQPIGDGITQKAGMEQPVYYWDPGIGPAGCTFYSGKLIKEWKNNLFVAALSGQHISRLIIRFNKIVGEERLLLSQHQRMRDIMEGPDGALWVLTDSEQGRLIRISPGFIMDKSSHDKSLKISKKHLKN